jgi:hypothetical protein
MAGTRPAMTIREAEEGKPTKADWPMRSFAGFHPSYPTIVMAGLVPAIHVFSSR